VHDMDPGRPRGGELLRDGGRVIAINGLPRRLALAQANDAAAADVDSGIEVQGPTEGLLAQRDRLPRMQQCQEPVALALELLALVPADRNSVAQLHPP